MALGKTGMEVSRLGFGLYEIGDLAGDAGAAEAGRLLGTALDGGINFLDTASCYGDSEEWIGRSVSHRRDEYVLATKCGHSVGLGAPPWTRRAVTEAIERSLKRLRTDHLDLVQLHSCDVDVLEAGDVIDALTGAKESGKTRFIGYSGDEDEAIWAVRSGAFDALQTSFNMVDQHARTRRILAEAEDRGMGIIIKRPVANLAWAGGATTSNLGDYVQRARAVADMGPIEGAPDDPIELSLGFTFAHPEVDTAIVGTRNIDHLRSNLALMERGAAMPSGAVEELHRRFDKLGDRWMQRM